MNTWSHKPVVVQQISVDIILDSFFGNLQLVYSRDQIEPQNIWNIDESGLTTVHKRTKIIVMKWEKRVDKVTFAEKGQFVQRLLLVGTIFLLSWYVLKKTVKIQNWKALLQVLIEQLFLDDCRKFWHHFKSHVKCSPSNKVVIIMDNHHSHITIKNLNFS